MTGGHANPVIGKVDYNDPNLLEKTSTRNYSFYENCTTNMMT